MRDVFEVKNENKLNADISKDQGHEKLDKSEMIETEMMTPVTSPSGKVTIGVWGQTKSELKIERAQSFGKVIRKQEVDEEKKSVVVSRSRKAEMRQRIPPEQKDTIEVTDGKRFSNSKPAISFN